MEFHKAPKPKELRFVATKEKGEVSALLTLPGDAKGLLVLGHGAGSNMRSPLLEGLSQKLGPAGIGTFRYQFPYTEAGGRRPDSRGILLETVRSAIGAAAGTAPGVRLFAGGHSMSGRMTSMAAAESPIPHLEGIVFLAFPLAGKAEERTRHLLDLTIPMLFLQGTRDRLTDLEVLQPLCQKLGDRVSLHVIDSADHSFKVLKRSGKTTEDAQTELAETIAEWMSKRR